MKRDMELIRKILLTVEEQYVDTALYDIKVEGYDLKTIAYHCNILYDAGLISNYKGFYADNELQGFGVSSLTWEGHEFIDKIRDDTVWNKTKAIIREKGIPFVLDTVKQIATFVIETTVQSVIKGGLQS